MMCAEEYINDIMQTYNTALKEYNALIKELSTFDLALQDILHNIELETFNAAEGYMLTKRIKEFRVERRKIKNTIEQLQIFISCLDESKLVKIKTRIKSKEEQQCKRKYTPRVLFNDSCNYNNEAI